MSGELKGYEKDYGEYTKHFRDQNGKCFIVSVMHDDSPEDPIGDGYANGKMHSFSTRHGTFLDLEKHGCYAAEDVPETLNELFGPCGEGWMALSYYEHGQCSWFPCGDQPIGVEFQWDGVRLAGVWEMDKDVLDNLGDPKSEGFAERAYKYCKGVCDMYTDWCNGNVYGYSVIVIDERGDQVADDSCWGYYGSDEDYMHDEIKGVLKYHGAEQLREIDEDEVFAVCTEEMTA